MNITLHWNAVLAVGIGAALGAWLRWLSTLLLNALFPLLPLGTLTANWLGAFLAGIALGYFTEHAGHPVLQWFVMTGFLGGLTTFSTFTAEAAILLQRGDYSWAFIHTAAHLIGSLALCFVGYGSYRLLN